jgi:hypothetical protein
MISTTSRSIRSLALVLLGAIVAGCSGGDELPRQEVSGTIRLGGEPLPSGFINFEPSAGQATGGGAVITDGSYSLPRDTGLVPGAYRISISSPSNAGGPGGDAPGSAGSMMQEGIPARYNSQSELTAEVTDGGDNTFDFDLEP